MESKINITNIEKRFKIFGIILNIILPWLIIVYVTKFYGGSLTSYLPVWNDEVSWWLQADAISQYGKPLGYWGYNGGTAEIGLFSAWGWASPYLYGIFGAVFGWEYYSYIYANILFSCASVAIFILLTKPSIKGIYILLGVNALQIVRNLYSFTAMNETGRHAIALVGLGLIYYLYKTPTCNKFVKYGLIPLWIVYCTQAYILLAILFFFYVYCLMVKKKWYWSFLVSTISFVLYGFISYKFLMMTSSPYLVTTLGFSINTLKSNLLGLVNILSGYSPFYQLYIATYIFTTISMIIYFLLRWKSLDQDDRMIYIVASLILLAWFGSFILLYSASDTTLIRGLSVALFMATFLMVLAKHRTPIYIFFICTVMTMLVSQPYNHLFFSGRFMSEKLETYLLSVEKQVNSVIEVNEHADSPWENTVVNFLGGSQLSLTLPAGVAINSQFDVNLILDAKYVFIEKQMVGEQLEIILANYLQNGFEMTSVNGDDVVILVNTKYS